MKINEIISEAEVKPYEKEVLDTGANSSNNYRLDRLEKTLRQFCPVVDELIREPIWRGFKNHNQEILKIDPSTGVRQSQNTSNYYTELMDNSPYFNGWPKRSRSIICSTEFGRASNYAYGAQNSAATYAVFPARGVKVAVCPGSDIWGTRIDLPFAFSGLDFPDLNVFLEYLGLSQDYSKMVKEVQSDFFARELGYLIKNNTIEPVKPEDFLPEIEEAMAPQNTGFQLYDLEEFAGGGIRDKELWIGGPCIIVRSDLLETLRVGGTPITRPETPYVAPDWGHH